MCAAAGYIFAHLVSHLGQYPRSIDLRIGGRGSKCLWHNSQISWMEDHEHQDNSRSRASQLLFMEDLPCSQTCAKSFSTICHLLLTALILSLSPFSDEKTEALRVMELSSFTQMSQWWSQDFNPGLVVPGLIHFTH